MSRKMVSVVAVLRDASGRVGATVAALDAAAVAACVPHGMDREIVLVDDGSTDGTFAEIEAAINGVPDTRALSLVSHGDPDAAMLAGMDSVLGDIVVLTDPSQDDPSAIPALVEAVLQGADLALAEAPPGTRRGALYGPLSAAFVLAFRAVAHIDLRGDASRYRAVTRRVVGYVTAHDNASLAHRTLPSMGGFRCVTVPSGGGAAPAAVASRGLSVGGGFRRALGILTATSTVPLRLATATCAIGAACSLAYSLYVAATYLFSRGVAPGWTTMSLQISGMFFLLSIAVALLSEYVLQMASSSYRRPPYHVAREARSAVSSRAARLNVVGS
jgi:hypothetical protein